MTWQLDQYDARLQREGFSARLDVSRPLQGLHEIDGGRIDGKAAAFAEANVLGIEFPSHAPDDSNVAEKYVRGMDLVADYRPTADWPIDTRTLWRVVPATRSDDATVTVELWVSVQTDLLSARAELHAQTTMPADEVFRLADLEAGRFSAWKPVPTGEPGQTTALGPKTGPGCLLFRRRGAERSYAEMIHPTDFCAGEFSGPFEASPARWRHRLFACTLEKGVILCARIRGLICPRANDESIVAEAYREFAAADPPLDGT